MPVLPAVASSTRPPGLRSPRFSASRIIHLPARSLTDWPGFMNSAFPRIVQPVASEARFSLMSGVFPMASTTSLLMVIIFVSAGFCFPAKRSQRRQAAQADGGACLSARLGEHDLAHVDISGEESSFAVSQIVFPQPPEALVKSERGQVGPSGAEVISPSRECLGIILPENALADNRYSERLAKRLQHRG